jgi:hypothetical protein
MNNCNEIFCKVAFNILNMSIDLNIIKLHKNDQNIIKDNYHLFLKNINNYFEFDYQVCSDIYLIKVIKILATRNL